MLHIANFFKISLPLTIQTVESIQDYNKRGQWAVLFGHFVLAQFLIHIKVTAAEKNIYIISF